jgi:hypothetical protein
MAAAHAPTADKSKNTKDTFHKTLQCVFYQFPKYNAKTLSGDFTARVGSEDIFKPIIGYKSLHKIMVMGLEK